MRISACTLADGEGYIERECPFCGYSFRVNAEDWTDRVSECEVHCPECGEKALSDAWWTKAQVELMSEFLKTRISAADEELIGLSALDSQNDSLTDASADAEYILRIYCGRRDIIEHSAECSCCGTRIRVIGCALICPCCGYSGNIKSYKGALRVLERIALTVGEAVTRSFPFAEHEESERLAYSWIFREAYRGFGDLARQVSSCVGDVKVSRSTFSTPSKTVRFFERLGGNKILERDELLTFDRLVKEYIGPMAAAPSKEDVLALTDILKKAADGIKAVLMF